MSLEQSYPKWFEFFWAHRKKWIGLFVGLGIFALAGLPFLQFNFSFEQFFPSEDEDLEFFQNFIKDFETDDNFLLLAFEKEPDVFEKDFLGQVDSLTKVIRQMPYIEEVRSLTSLEFPRKTPFGPVPVRVLPFEDSTKLSEAAKLLPKDPRFSGRLLSEDGSDIIVFVKTIDNLSLPASRELRKELDPALENIAPQPYHYLGRAYFQTELVDMQTWEVAKSSIIAGILISIVMFFLYRKPMGIAISLTSISLSLLLFFGYLAWSGSALNVMAALYPILMIIVGTSDVIHIMSKYIDEGLKSDNRKKVLFVTIKEIGLATLLTSITTAIGFASLSYSRITSIQEFGYNAAIGVLIAYIAVIFFTTSWLSYYDPSELQKAGKLSRWWPNQLNRLYNFTRFRKKWIWAGLVVGVLLSAWGISMISTNYTIMENLPEGYKVRSDFEYFEKMFGGYRPYEYALMSEDGGAMTDYQKMKAIHQLEEYLKEHPEVQRVNGPSEAFQLVEYYQNNNKLASYAFPSDEGRYEQHKKTLSRLGAAGRLNALVTEDGQKARVSATVQDIGADRIKEVQKDIRDWFEPIATEVGLSFKATGTGVIFDKNSVYVRESLIYGLGLAIGIVSLLMGLLFRSFAMLLIALVPNVVPLIMAGALLGFTGTDLEAGIAIIFAVVFGIAVDDTIHFLSKYKIARSKGQSREEAIQTTFVETGKAILLTSIILFAGFMILFFSVHPPTRTVGWLISVTLVSALAADLLLIPLLVRWIGKKED